jgi:hypothetical protein
MKIAGLSLSFGRADRNPLARWFWTIDRPLLAIVLVLIGCGIIAVAAASPAAALRLSGGAVEIPPLHFLWRQLIWVMLGLPLMLHAGRLVVALQADAQDLARVDQERLGEDLRKLYVALTRAGDELVITSAASRNGNATGPSPWVAAVEATTEQDRSVPPPTPVRSVRPVDPLAPLREWRRHDRLARRLAPPSSMSGATAGFR